MHKLKKGYAVIAAAVLIICAAAAVFFVLKSGDSSGSSLSEKKISGISFTEPREFEAHDALEKLTDEATGKEYAKSFMLGANAYIILDDDGVIRLYDENGAEIKDCEFADDIGNYLTAESENGVITFYTDSGGQVDTFLVNDHTLELMNDKIYIDLIAMKYPEPSTEAAEESDQDGEAEGDSSDNADESGQAEGEQSEDSGEVSEEQAEPEETVLLADEEQAEESAEGDSADESSQAEGEEQNAEDENSEQAADGEENAATEPETAADEDVDVTGKVEYVPADSYSKELIRLINAERTKRGLTELLPSSVTGKVSLIRAGEITESFSHTRNGQSADSILESYGASYNFYGENIAAGQKTAADVVSDWMNSKAMRDNILNPDAVYIGCAAKQLSKDKNSLFNYWTACFFG